jgi:hypothetical protein
VRISAKHAAESVLNTKWTIANTAPKRVKSVLTLGYSELSVFRRAAQTERESTAWERKRIAKLDAERARIKDASVTAAPIYQQGDQATRACRRLLLAPVSLMHLKGPGATPPGFVVD